MAFSINKSYTFTTLAPAILGGVYNTVKVKSMMSATEAVKYRDIHTLHTSVKSLIQGVPSSVNDLTYILFEANDANKAKTLLALEYIDPFTIKEVTSITINIKVSNAQTTDISLIRASLLEIGITDFDITTT